MKFFSFRIPDPLTAANQRLREAELALLDAEDDLSYAKARVAAHRERIARLRKFKPAHGSDPR